MTLMCTARLTLHKSARADNFRGPKAAKHCPFKGAALGSKGRSGHLISQKTDCKTTEEMRFTDQGRQLAALKDDVAIQRYILPMMLARSLTRRHPSPD